MAGLDHAALCAGGPDVSSLAWGSWRAIEQFEGPADLARFLGAILDIGITTLDAADVYGGYAAEAFLGKALAELGADAEQFEIITKCGIAAKSPARPEHKVKHYNSSAAHIRASAEASCRHLGRERINVLLIHRPDILMDAKETADAFDALIAAGTIGYAGVSNFTAPQIELFHAALKSPLVTNQIEFSPLHLDPIEDGTLDQAQRLGIRPMLWSPFGGGSLFSGDAPQAARIRAALEGVAENYGLGLAGAGAGPAAIAWLMRHPTKPVPVVGTSKLDRLKGLVAAANVSLDRQDWYAIYEAILGRRVA